MRPALLLAGALLAVLAGGCSDDSVVHEYPAGAFRYAAYDTLGHTLVEGYLTITQADGDRVVGVWAMTRVGSSDMTGPQVGKGILEGSITGTTIRINLNPNMIDNNVLLSGVLNGNSYTGTWIYIGFPGLLNRGTFVARR